MGEERIITKSAVETKRFGARLARTLRSGDTVLLKGELGAGKTTLVRGLLEELGVTGAVRSPTFNLIALYDTTPPVAHADLFRLKSAEGLGLEDYLQSHVCLIEWPDRALGLLQEAECVVLELSQGSEPDERVILLRRP